MIVGSRGIAVHRCTTPDLFLIVVSLLVLYILVGTRLRTRGLLVSAGLCIGASYLVWQPSPPPYLHRPPSEEEVSRRRIESPKAAAHSSSHHHHHHHHHQLWGSVCVDGRASVRAKILLTACAKTSIVASLNYGGGQCLQEWLVVLAERLAAGVQATIIASQMYITPTNLATIEELRARYPDPRLRWQWSEPRAEWLVQTRTLNMSSNHLKCLVIDGGAAFVLGGSGLEDAYNQSGLEDAAYNNQSGLDSSSSSSSSSSIDNGGGSSWLPTRFRDMDWIFGSFDGAPSTTGQELHTALESLQRRWAHMMEAKTTYHLALLPVVDAPHLSIVASTTTTTTTTTPSITNKSSSNKHIQRHLREAGFRTVAVSDPRLLLTTPQQKVPEFQRSLLWDLQKAHKEIWIAHMFLHWQEDFQEALVAALLRGVRVNIISNDDDDVRAPWAHSLYVPRSKIVVLRLVAALEQLGTTGRQAARLHLRVYHFRVEACTYHKKLVLIDDDLLWVGNSNLGDKSLLFGSDDEVNMRLRSDGLVASTLEVLHLDLRSCVEWKPFDDEKSESSSSSSVHSSSRKVSRQVMAWLHEKALCRLLG